MKTQRFQDLIAKNPNNELFRFSLAQALIEEGRHAEALEQLHHCVEKKPDWMMAEILRGKSLIALGRKDEAKTVLGQALHLAIEQHHETPEAKIRQLLASF